MKDYILLFRNNLKIIILISSLIIVLAALYAILAKNIYTSTVSVRITNPSKNILENGRQNPDNAFLDRYIVSEMDIINNYSTREKIANALIDSFKTSNVKDLFFHVKAEKDEGTDGHKTVEQLAGLLGGVIQVEQNQGTDVCFCRISIAL